MPHFERFYEAKIRGALGDADAEAVLDLRGLGPDAAEAAVEAMLAQAPGHPSSAPTTVAVRLDPPGEGGGETLFQPVGRRLLAARREGVIAHLYTLPAEDGLGFYVAVVHGLAEWR